MEYIYTCIIEILLEASMTHCLVLLCLIVECKNFSAVFIASGCVRWRDRPFLRKSCLERIWSYSPAFVICKSWRSILRRKKIRSVPWEFVVFFVYRDIMHYNIKISICDNKFYLAHEIINHGVVHFCVFYVAR